MLRRARLYERASAEAGIVLDRIGLQILGHVRKAEQPPSVKELAEAMQVEGPHATRQVQKLVARVLLLLAGGVLLRCAVEECPHDGSKSVVLFGRHVRSG